jgi:hypothetical protein
MSEYQYYEFCQLGKPLSQEARKEMSSLSSRAQVGTHGASYVYNFGDFRGNPKKLLLKYFDVFLYISNFGILRLIFKYSTEAVNLTALKLYCLKNVIECEQVDENVVLTVELNNEEGLGWTEGEGLLSEFLPFYDEIKKGNYHFLELILAIHQHLSGRDNDSFKVKLKKMAPLSKAQKLLIENIGVAIE